MTQQVIELFSKHLDTKKAARLKRVTQAKLEAQAVVCTHQRPTGVDLQVSDLLEVVEFLKSKTEESDLFLITSIDGVIANHRHEPLLPTNKPRLYLMQSHFAELVQFVKTHIPSAKIFFVSQVSHEKIQTKLNEMESLGLDNTLINGTLSMKEGFIGSKSGIIERFLKQTKQTPSHLVFIDIQSDSLKKTKDRLSMKTTCIQFMEGIEDKLECNAFHQGYSSVDKYAASDGQERILKQLDEYRRYKYYQTAKALLASDL
ncbi:hypothetical protein D5018_08105 [Parashewanella curva]|uniref:Uncharacterized protein n=1 Tax=Parashewanella curva TaxID=2338552 RepID=A0A3L8PXM6_9GAMM|nr:hypothetical protein [Parashewanella curva]RLV60217.1 hypothetical protein D5018_08105 [Parashewanella curva]